MGQGEYWDYILNAYATPYFRSIVNKYPAPKIKVYNKGGYFSAYNSKHGIIYTPKGSTTDISTLLHEYGHYLDNILGFEIQGTTDGIKLATSKLFVDEMIADGTSLGLVIDSSAYWQNLFDNGIDTSFKGTTKFKVLKGRSQQEISRKMKPGDFWRVMEEIQTLAKGDVTKIKNTKNPDPVKLKRAEETYANLTGLYDKYLEGIESAKQLLDNAMSLKLGENKTEEEGGIVEHLGALMDIIEALTSGDFTDYQIATGDHFSPRGHGGGYYSTRLYRDDKKWKVRNHNQETADNFKRYEIFAQLSQFMSHKDDTAIQFMRLTMPNLVEKFTEENLEVIEQAIRSNRPVDEASLITGDDAFISIG